MSIVLSNPDPICLILLLLPSSGQPPWRSRCRDLRSADEGRRAGWVIVQAAVGIPLAAVVVRIGLFFAGDDCCGRMRGRTTGGGTDKALARDYSSHYGALQMASWRVLDPATR